MANMELTPAQSKEEGKEMTDYRPRWAVSEIYLGDDALKAIGVENLPALGSLVRFSGVAKVVSGRLDDDQQGEPDKNCMSIQPVELDLAPAPADARSMFPKSKMEP